MNRIIPALLLIALLFTNLFWLTFVMLGPERVITALERRVNVYFGLESGGNFNVPVELIVDAKLTNDPLSKYQWALRMLLDGSEYWEIQGDAPRDVVVAVIDRSPHMQHVDLENQLYSGGGTTLLMICQPFELKMISGPQTVQLLMDNVQLVLLPLKQPTMKVW